MPFFAARFDGHVGNGHAIVDAEAGNSRAVKLHGAISGPVKTDFAGCNEV